ncbi:hypothetical protein T07_1419 [Trichinella nelsoni]|uniref:Uncharacterized protein n=1 Tax=Trichinella nelsoni TaxID=6336 RepID=A0A0V0RKT2_9BILA|nr:hypothetical protein T07_1419 [Trichinella nelsoni]
MKNDHKKVQLNSWNSHSIRSGEAELNERNAERKISNIINEFVYYLNSNVDGVLNWFKSKKGWLYFASDAAKMKKQKAACHVKPLKGRQPATTGRRSDAFNFYSLAASRHDEADQFHRRSFIYLDASLSWPTCRNYAFESNLNMSRFGTTI